MALWIATNVFLVKTALADPGFIPRQAETQFIQTNRSAFKNYLMLSGVKNQQLAFFNLKFCSTCKFDYER